MTAPLIPSGQRPPKPERALSDEQERDRAFRDAMRSLKNPIIPAEAAGWLGLAEIGALHGAIQAHGAWRLTRTDAAHADLVHSLRLSGLVEINGPFLTAHGMAVRRVIKDAER